MADEDFTHLTEGGEIRFQTDKKYFVFYNPTTPVKEEDTKDKRGTICILLTVRNLVKYLPIAKAAARNFNEDFAAASPETAEQLKLQEGEIYSRVLSTFPGNENFVSISHRLIVSTYNGKAYIWLKRFFLDDNQEYKACRGGYWFSQNDDEDALGKFVERCMQFCQAQRQIILEKRLAPEGGETEEGIKYFKKTRAAKNK